MAVKIATDEEFQKDFDNYLRAVMYGDEIVLTRDGREIARVLPHGKVLSLLSESMLGVLKHDYDDKAVREERVLRHESVG